MSTVFVVYDTTEGHTTTIVDHLREALEEGGYTVVVARAGESLPQIPADADGVIVGASVHAGKHQVPVREFVKANLARLDSSPSAFFQVCMAAAELSPESDTETAKYLESFFTETGWRPKTSASFAGMLAWAQYDFFTRLIMRLITRKEVPHPDLHRDQDYTDYDAVRQFALDFAEGLS
jgi:menaquinone-dependent protoporphyrinogen oxidase